MRMSLDVSIGRTCLSQPALTIMTNRHACIDLTEESDSETQECVSAEDRAGDLSPIQWRIMMTKIIIGAFHWWCQDGVQMLQCDCFYYWAEAIKPDQLKFLLRRDVVMPALESDHVLQFSQWWSTLTTELLQLQMDTGVPPWKPREDYSHFFMHSKDGDEANMLAVAELRWLASGGLLFMDSNVNIREDHERRTGTRTMGSHPGHHARNRASRVDSIPPTKECMDLLACLEGWNNYQLPHELGNRTGGSTKPLSERQLPKELLSVLVEYTVSNWCSRQHAGIWKNVPLWISR